MITKELIDEINTLARKAKNVGLTSEEKKRQLEVRKIYLEAFKENFKQQLEQIEIVDGE